MFSKIEENHLLIFTDIGKYVKMFIDVKNF